MQAYMHPSARKCVVPKYCMLCHLIKWASPTKNCHFVQILSRFHFLQSAIFISLCYVLFSISFLLETFLLCNILNTCTCNECLHSHNLEVCVTKQTRQYLLIILFLCNLSKSFPILFDSTIKHSTDINLFRQYVGVANRQRVPFPKSWMRQQKFLQTTHIWFIPITQQHTHQSRHQYQ